MPMSDRTALKIRNAHENNLKSLSIDLPHDQLVGITGLSGSGKSSLAFDTIYAEGQRRYIETFSPYTRQFFDKVKKPKVDSVENVRPAIAIQQRTRVMNSRSTVGSMTDINDLLKIVWSNLALPVCPKCGRALEFWDAKSVTRRIGRWCEIKTGSTFLIGAIVPNKGDSLDRLKTLGYHRYFDPTSGVLQSIEEVTPPKRAKSVVVVIDRCKSGSFNQKRIQDSVDQAFSLGERSLVVVEQREKVCRPLIRSTVEGETSIPASTHETYRFHNSYQCGDGAVVVGKARPSLFSSTHPIGACPTCTGFGKVLVIDRNKCVPDHSKSIKQHVIECWRGNSAEWEYKHLLSFCKERNIPIDKPWRELSAADKELIFTHKSRSFVGIEPWFEHLEKKKYKMHVRVFLARYRGQVECPDCNGTRLRSDSLAYKIDGLSISEVMQLPLDELSVWFSSLRQRAVGNQVANRQLKDVCENIATRLDYLVKLGLPYLTLDRQARTLSGGETQRVNLVSAVGSNLISAHFVLDEPSVGLHARDTEQLIGALRDLTERGNSVTIVEHDPECLMAADTIVELGPGAGEDGGAVTFSGPRAKWEGLGITPFSLQSEKRDVSGNLKIRGAANRNLKKVDIDVPLNSFVCLTGVSGSGKSSLLTEVLHPAYELFTGKVPAECHLTGSVTGFEQVNQVLFIDQSPLAKSPRANIATYTKIWDKVRDYFAASEAAEALGLSKSAFSFNVNAGRCPTCEGAGHIREDMQFLSDVFIECESCLGMRFQPTVLSVRLREKNVHDLLTMSVDACAEFFREDPFIGGVCTVLSRLGLGHITLGHPLSELSGGEAQRLKLVPHIVKGSSSRSLFLFDEPTTGLHVRDVENLIELFCFLRDEGHSILCVEHNLRLIAAADWIIDLGPEGGSRGGQLVKEGSPYDFVSAPAGLNGTTSLTARYLKEFVEKFGASPKPKRSSKVVTQKPRRPLQRATAIQITGAREHNLRNVDVSIPLNTFVTLTGVSGSGKSTIAKDILYAEGQRRYLDCLSPYARQFIKELKKPDIDDIRNVQPTICVYQHTFQPSALSTVATMSEVYNFLRLLYAKVGTQHCPDHPEQVISPLSAEQIAAIIKSSYKGSVRVLAPIIKQKKGNHRAVIQRALDSEISEIRVDGVFGLPSRFIEKTLPKTKVHSIDFVVARFNTKSMPEDLIAEGAKLALSIGGGNVIIVSDGDERVFSSERTCQVCQRGFFKPDPEDLSFNSRRGRCERCDGTGSVRNKVCPECNGARINANGRSIKLGGKNIFELCSQAAPDLLESLRAVERNTTLQQIAEPILRELEGKLSTLLTLGLDYVSLNRDCATLSNGELQRLRLGTAMGSPLCGVTYIFDEPSAGLHPSDNRKLLAKLVSLRERGNTVIQIEHEMDSVMRSDLIIDVGPGAGRNGGQIVFSGSVADALHNSDSPTGVALRTPLEVRTGELTSTEYLDVVKPTKNNLRGDTIRIPLRSLVTVAGVSGAGKSSLIHGVVVECLGRPQSSEKSWKCEYGSLKSTLPIERFLVVDQQPIGRTSRSTPASYLGVWDEIRKLFAETLEAKSRGWTASHFSHNSGNGRCPTCKGQGELKLEMSFLAEAKVQCESCMGNRFTADADSVKFRDLSISEVLKLTFDEARIFFMNHRKIHQICRHACELGLGYLTLGQPSSTLSGGESQRIKLVDELHVERKEHSLYVLDEPTTGLHRSDVALLLRGLKTLVEQGHSVLVIEHDADVIASSDWVIELGPGPGVQGGNVVFKGEPQLLEKHDSPWGVAMRERISLHQQLSTQRAA